MLWKKRGIGKKKIVERIVSLVLAAIVVTSAIPFQSFAQELPDGTTASSQPADPAHANSTPASSEPASSTPASSEPASSTPASSTPASSEPASSSTPASSEPASSTPASSSSASSSSSSSESADSSSADSSSSSSTPAIIAGAATAGVGGPMLLNLPSGAPVTDPDEAPVSQKTFKVTFELNNGSPDEEYDFTEGTSVLYPGSSNPTKTDHVFDGWDPALTTFAYDSSDGAANEYTTTAQWIPITQSVTVTVKYVAQDGVTELANPFIAQVDKGYTFSEAEAVAIPTFTDYTYQESKITVGATPEAVYNLDANNKVLNGLQATDKIIINVIYKAEDNVKYQVIHNYGLYDDKGVFTLDSTVSDTEASVGYGALVTPIAKPNADYTLATTIVPTAINDRTNTQIINLYYDRAVKSVTFDSKGGSYVEPISGKWGTKFTLPEGNDAPTRDGYTFEGWALSTDPTIKVTGDQTIPATGASYVALWKGEPVQYTVVYWLEKENLSTDNGLSIKGNALGADVANYDFHSSDATKTALAGTKISDVFDTAPSGLTHAEYAWQDSDVEIAGDGSTIINVYYTRLVYTFKFPFSKSWLLLDGTLYHGNNIPSGYQTTRYTELLADDSVAKFGTYTMQVKLGDNIEQTWPTRTGFEFSGVTFEMGDNYFQWRYPSNIAGTFKNVGTGLREIEVSEGMLPTNWSTDLTVTFSEAANEQNDLSRLVYYYEATDAEIATYTAYSGGVPTSAQMLARVPSSTYYTVGSGLPTGEVDGNYNGTPFVVSPEKTQNMLYSGTTFGPKALLGFTSVREEGDGYSSFYLSKYLTADQSVGGATRYGNFYYVRERNNFKYNPTGGELVVGGNTYISTDPYTITGVKYQEPFSYNDGTNDVLMAGLLADTVEPTKDGFTFVGWYIDEAGMNKFDPLAGGTMPNAEMMVYAKWEPNTYEVELQPNNAVQNNEKLTIDNDTAFVYDKVTNTYTPLTEPEGKVFLGWYEVLYDNTGKETGVAEFPFVFGTAPNRDIVLRALWVEEGTSYTIVHVSGANSFSETTVLGSTGDPIEFAAKTSDQLTDLASNPAIGWPQGVYTVSSVSAVVTSNGAAGAATTVTDTDNDGDYDYTVAKGSNVITLNYLVNVPQYNYTVKHVDESGAEIIKDTTTGATYQETGKTPNTFMQFRSIAIPNYSTSETTKTVNMVQEAVQDQATGALNVLVTFTYKAVPQVTYEIRYLYQNQDASGNALTTYKHDVTRNEIVSVYPGVVTITPTAANLLSDYVLNSGNVYTKTVGSGTVFYVYYDLKPFVDLTATPYTGVYDADLNDRLTSVVATAGATLSYTYVNEAGTSVTTADRSTIEKIVDVNLSGKSDYYPVTITATHPDHRSKTITVEPKITKATLIFVADDINDVVYGKVLNAAGELEPYDRAGNLISTGYSFKTGNGLLSGTGNQDTVQNLGLTISYSTNATNTSLPADGPYEANIRVDLPAGVTELRNYKIKENSGKLRIINSTGLTIQADPYVGDYDSDAHDPITAQRAYIDAQPVALSEVTLSYEYRFTNTDPWTAVNSFDELPEVTNVWDATGNNKGLRIRITASKPGYQNEVIKVSPTINEVDLAISVDQINDINYQDPIPTFGYTVDPQNGFKGNDEGLVDVTLSTSYDPTDAQNKDAGTYTVALAVDEKAGTVPANLLDNYNLILSNGEFEVLPLELILTPNTLTVPYFSAVPSLTGAYTITGFAQGEDATTLGITDTDVPLLTDYVQGSPVGTSYRVYLDDANNNQALADLNTLADPNYTFTVREGAINVSPLPLTLTPTLQSVEYGDALILANLFTLTGFAPGESIINYGITGADVVLNSSYAVGDDAGLYGGSITVDPSSRAVISAKASNYTVNYESAPLNVTQAAFTVTASSFTRTAGTANPALTYFNTALKLGETPAGIGVPVTLATTADETSIAGVYPITAAGPATTTNYIITYLPGTMTVTGTIPVEEEEEGPPVDIEEEETPTGDGDEEDEPVVIEEEDTPTGDGGAWSLVDLILTLITGMMCIVLLLGYLTKKERDDNQKARQNKNEDDGELKRKGAFRLFSMVPMIAAIITFILTQDLTQPMILVDRWTILFVIIFLVQVLTAVLSKKKYVEDKDKQNTANA